MTSTFQFLMTPTSLLLMALGTSLGVMVGAVPGLTGAMLIALTLPLTFSMGGESALVLLISMYVGSVSGGMITATLLRMPGTPASIMTTLDGYPMAKQGKPGRALGLGVVASFVGGMISWVFLVALAAPMAAWSTKFGPFEFFALVMMAMVLIASVGGKSLMKGLLAGFLGILATMPGTAPATGQIRWTFGVHAMDDGFKLLPVLIGLFAVNQIIRDIVHLDEPIEKIELKRDGMFLSVKDWLKNLTNLVRSSVIGTWIGILPGIGANVGSVVAYAAARSMSKTPEKFGHGSEEGIVASESANNATVGGALIPLIAMGIPGSVIDAILLGALVIHGLQPGPLLFEQNPEAVYVVMGTMFLANIFMLVFMLVSLGWLSKLASIPRAYLLPVILTCCVIGSFALGNRMFDVWVMLGFGVFGFALEKMKLPLAPFVIGFVLAPIAEEHLCAGLMQSGGSYWPLITRPISLIFCIVAVLLLSFSIVQHLKTNLRSSDE
ncbi:tripartite tricarboxylate transporter permease [Mariniblastus sp.]|nr:tripartite tricarboxylate transporter permease [Mariniblastus sp.]